jgi:hypothetical protein
MGDGSVQVRTTGLRHDWTKSVEPYLSTVTPGFPSATPCMTRYACLGFGEDSVRQSGMHTGACMIRLAAGRICRRCVRTSVRSSRHLRWSPDASRRLDASTTTSARRDADTVADIAPMDTRISAGGVR